MSLLSEQHVATLPGDRLRDAACVTAGFLADIAPIPGRRRPSDDEVRSVRIERLIASEAWTDAALALVERELPQWQVRRLAYDGGEWFCSLSRQRELPEWLDQPVEAHHADLARAILAALAEARRITAEQDLRASAVTHDADPLRNTLYCDNLG
jgi:hypothetical protein